MCVCVSLCNHTAWQMTKPVWWQCTHNLLLGSPTCCKNEAVPVLTMRGRLGITTDRPGVGPFWQPGTHECKLGAGREQFPAAEIERISVQDCSGTHRPLLQPHLPRCHDHHPLPVPSMSAELRDAFRAFCCSPRWAHSCYFRLSHLNNGHCVFRSMTGDTQTSTCL